MAVPTVPFLHRLPDDMIFHVIQFENDRWIWPFLSKKFYQLWVEAGLAALNDRNNPLMRELVASWDQNPKRIDRLLMNLAKYHLLPSRTCLSPSMPVPTQDEIVKAVVYRSTHSLNSWHSQLNESRQRQLVAFADWLMITSPDARLVFEHLPRSKSLAEQAKFVQEELKKNREIAIPENAALQVYDLSAIPEEILQLNVHRRVLIESLNVSIQRKQKPFLAALLHSDKVQSISSEVTQAFIGAIQENEQSLIQLFLASPRLSQEAFRTFFGVVYATCLVMESEKRVFLLEEFLASRHLELATLESSLRVVSFLAPGNLADRLMTMRRLLADPRVNATLLANVLGYASAFSKLNIQDLHSVVRQLLAHERLDAQELGLAMGLLCGHQATMENPISFENLLGILATILSDPRTTDTSRYLAIATIARTREMSLESRQALIALFVAGIREKGLEEALTECCVFGDMPIDHRLGLIRQLLRHQHMNPQIFGNAFLYASGVGNISLNDRRSVLGLLFNDSRLTDTALAEGIKGVVMYGRIIPVEARREILPLILAHPRNSSGALNRLVPYILLGNEAHTFLTPEEEASLVRQFLADPRFSDADWENAFYHLVTNGRTLPGRLALMRLFLDSPRISREARKIALTRAIDAVSKSHSIPELQLVAVIREFLIDPQMSPNDITDVLLVIYHLKQENARHLLSHPTLTSSHLWRFLPSLVKHSELPHSVYREALGALANHPKISQVPIVVRAMLVFERVLAFLTVPLRALLGLVFSQHNVSIIVGGLLFPITMFRAVVHGAFLVAAKVT